MSKIKLVYSGILIIVVAIAIIASWQYAYARQEINDLEKQVAADMQPHRIIVSIRRPARRIPAIGPW